VSSQLRKATIVKNIGTIDKNAIVDSGADSTLRHLGTAAIYTVVTVVLLGIVYPLVMTGIALAIFPNQANGSLVYLAGGRILSSATDRQGARHLGRCRQRAHREAGPGARSRVSRRAARQRLGTEPGTRR
jgi:hypothetical protein